jgi:hypothetical protein
VIERSGGGVVTAPAATPSAQATPAAQPSQATPKRRRAARPREPKFANSDEANWYYASKAWITPNQADKLGCQSSYAATYTLYHLRCINQVKGF